MSAVFQLIQVIAAMIGAGKDVGEIVEYVKNSAVGKAIEARHQADVAAFVAQAAKDYPNLPTSNAQAMENLKTMGAQIG